MRLRSFALTDIGLRRDNNEDAFVVDDALGLYVVADGVGGSARGELASSQGVEEVHGFVQRNRVSIADHVAQPSEDTRSTLLRLMESAVQHACYMVFGLGEIDPMHRGMSTTMSTLLVAPAGETATVIVAQVGDSRVYRVRDGAVVQLTEDHTLVNYRVKKGLMTVEEAEKSPSKNIITRAVGHRDYVQVDTFEFEALPGDVYLLCSDGLHGAMRDDEIPGVLAAGPLEDAPARLIELANDRGGKDNITVVLVSVQPG